VTFFIQQLHVPREKENERLKMKKKLAAGLAVLMTAGLIMVPASPANAANAALQKEIADIKKSNDKFTYWIGLIFSDVANQAAVDQINAWGKLKGIKVDPVLVNQNNTNAQITAALAAGTMPDAFDAGSGLMLQLGAKNLLNVQDLVDGLIRKNGALNPAAAASNLASYAGKGLGVPYGVNGNLINRRLDLIPSKKAPATWDELLSQANAAMPSGGGMGFNTGNVGDAEAIFGAQLLGYGGRIADNAGKLCTLDSKGTRDFLTWVKKAYDSGAYATDSTNSDGAWDNNKYLGGKTAIIANPGSVYTTLLNGSATWEKNPTLAKNTGFSALPGGPVMRVAPSDFVVRLISKTTKYPELSKDLISYLMQKPQIQSYYRAAIYGPAFAGYNTFTFWRKSVDPARAGLYELAMFGVTGKYPDVNNTAIAEFTSGFGISKMVQRYLFDKVSMDKAIDEAQASCAAIYKKY
jgi:multiple sugar transport system substrate-binding protein